MSRRSDAVNPQGRHHVPSLTPLSESLPIDDTVLSVYDQRTVYLVNIFIVDTVRFLNRFSAICEEKLMEVHSKMLKLDSTLTLLEAELRSIDECRGPKQCCGIETDGDLDGSMQQDTSSDSNLKEHLIRSGTDGLDVQSPKASLDKQINIMNEDDPRMLEFQRMLRFGVPEETLKMQLIMEGFDASSLNLFHSR